MIPFVYMFWIVGVAGGAAGSITSEREEDTWTSLTTTDLTAREIVLAKMGGAFWGMRLLGLVLVVLWTLGLIGGALHPIGVLANVAQVIVYGWFAAALGMGISLQAKSTRQAQFLTIAFLFMINISGQTIYGLLRQNAPPIWPDFTPVQISRTLFAPGYLEHFARAYPTFQFRVYGMDTGIVWSTVNGLLGLFLYGAGAGLLTWGSLVSFRTAAGRPRLRKRPHPNAAGTPTTDDRPEPEAVGAAR